MLDDSLLSQLPDTLTVDLDGKAVPLREAPFVKEAPDFPTFVKTAFDAHREVGARIPIKHDGKPESIEAWRKTHIPTLQKAGLLRTPPASLEEYGVTKPEEVPEGLVWDDDRAKKFAGVLHKYGVPKEIVPELMALNVEALNGFAQSLKTSREEAEKSLKAEFGDKYPTMLEDAKRLTAAIFKTPEELAFFEQTGIGNHPVFLSILGRLAPLAMQDSSILANTPQGGTGGGEASGEAVRAEVASIASDPANPRYKGYHSGDPTVMAYIDELYKKAYGSGTVEVSGGSVR